MYNLTAADFADTGQWRLILNITTSGLEAFLENTIHPEIPAQKLCEASWERNYHEIRKYIEEAVYDNPRLLDDFSAKIVLFDPKTLFIPTYLSEENSDSEAEYCSMFGGEPSDVMTASDGDITAAWSMGPGVCGFLYRTFPGARISCNLLEKVRDYRRKGSGKRIFIDARGNEADIVFLNDENLISASTHEWKDADDIAYLVFNLLDIYNSDLEDTALFLRNLDIDTDAWHIVESRCRLFEKIKDENNQR